MQLAVALCEPFPTRETCKGISEVQKRRQLFEFGKRNIRLMV
jgi:hypothetical protein